LIKQTCRARLVSYNLNIDLVAGIRKIESGKISISLLRIRSVNFFVTLDYFLTFDFYFQKLNIFIERVKTDFHHDKYRLLLCHRLISDKPVIKRLFTNQFNILLLIRTVTNLVKRGV